MSRFLSTRLRSRFLFNDLWRSFNRSYSKTYSGLLTWTSQRSFERTISGYSHYWHIRGFHQSHDNSSKALYEVLGVFRNADQNETKKIYYESAKKYHLVASKNDPQAMKKFQEICMAYEELRDKTKLEKHDKDDYDNPDLQFGSFEEVLGDKTKREKHDSVDYDNPDFQFASSEEVIGDKTKREKHDSVDYDKPNFQFASSEEVLRDKTKNQPHHYIDDEFYYSPSIFGSSEKVKDVVIKLHKVGRELFDIQLAMPEETFEKDDMYISVKTQVHELLQELEECRVMFVEYGIGRKDHPDNTIRNLPKFLGTCVVIAVVATAWTHINLTRSLTELRRKGERNGYYLLNAE